MRSQTKPRAGGRFAIAAAMCTAAAVAASPATSAKSFSDTVGNTHERAIDALSDAGIISGYPNGAFQPNRTLTRSDVVKLLGKWMVSQGYEVPHDYKAAPRFSDLRANADAELLKYAAVVYDNQVFIGTPEGKLQPTLPISRENMALVLVRAMDRLEKKDLKSWVEAREFARDVQDYGQAKSESRPAIAVLDYFDITNPAVPNFQPKQTTTRGQFATFLCNFMGVDLSEVENQATPRPHAPIIPPLSPLPPAIAPQAVDRAELASAIDEANAALYSAEYGMEYGRFTRASIDVYRTALIDALNAYYYPPASQADIARAASALRSATLQFQQRRLLTPQGIDRALLGQLIETAERYADTAETGVERGRYTPGSIQTLRTAIAAASLVYRESAPGQARLDEAVLRLRTALTDFLAARLPSFAETDRSRLALLQAKAAFYLRSPEYALHPTNYPASASRQLKEELDNSYALSANPYVPQRQIDEATTRLQAAIEAFERSATKETPTLPSPPPPVTAVPGFLELTAAASAPNAIAREMGIFNYQVRGTLADSAVGLLEITFSSAEGAREQRFVDAPKGAARTIAVDLAARELVGPFQTVRLRYTSAGGRSFDSGDIPIVSRAF